MLVYRRLCRFQKFGFVRSFHVFERFQVLALDFCRKHGSCAWQLLGLGQDMDGDYMEDESPQAGVNGNFRILKWRYCTI